MKTIGLLFLPLVFTITGFAQQSSRVDSADTNRILIIDPGISTGRPVLLLPPSLRDDEEIIFPHSFLLAGKPGAPPPFLMGISQPQTDLLAPLKLQMQGEEKLRPLRTILGTVQIGGVAYMAYRYLKKHGLK